MPLADLEDINVHLPTEKIEVDSALYAPLQLDAERIVRGYLAGFFTPAELASWSDPDSTPGLIRAIAGRFIAAFYYRLRYSEDSLEDPTYAQNKYNEAMGMLKGVLDGSLVLEEVVIASPIGQLTSADFWPNNTTTPGPAFTMGMEL